MASTAIPTLGSSLMLDQPSDKIDYVLRFYASAPKQVNNSNISQAISLASTLSEYSYDRTQVVTPIRTELMAEFSRVFPEASTIDVEVSTSEVTTSTYTISITPSVVISGVTYSVSRTLTAANGALVLANDTVTS